MSPLPDFRMPETVTTGLPAKTTRAGTETLRTLPHSFPSHFPSEGTLRNPISAYRHEPVYTSLRPGAVFRKDAG